MNPSHQFSKSHVHLLQAHCFLQIFPRNRKIILKFWPGCQLPCAFPEPHPKVWLSQGCCVAVVPLAALFAQLPCGIWSCSTLPVVFGHCTGTGTSPCQGCRAALWGGVAMSWKWRARGENLHILFQIPRASQDSFRGVCMLFVLGDEIRSLFRFKWPSSVHWDCSRPLRPSECGSWSCSSKGSVRAAGPAIPEPAVGVPELWTPLCSKHALISCSGEGLCVYSGCFLSFPSVIWWSPAFCGSPEPDHLGLVRGQWQNCLLFQPFPQKSNVLETFFFSICLLQCIVSFCYSLSLLCHFEAPAHSHFSVAWIALWELLNLAYFN